MTVSHAYLAIIIACLIAALFIVAFAERIDAATLQRDPFGRAAALDVPPCEAINSAGNIVIYFCERENGEPYLINSVGFMLQKD